MLKFGSISYLNLLPFQVFLKQRVSNTQFKQMLRYKKGVPSLINQRLKRGEIDGAFISSIHSPLYECEDLGIIANGAVYSVLVIDGDNKRDIESATSNILAKVLGIDGEVIIGDKALRYYLEGREAQDLSLIWRDRYSLPFVFARLCYRKKSPKLKCIGREFLSKRVKIPYYILKRESSKRNIDIKDTIWYLSHISYKMGWREKRGLKKFLKLSKHQIRR